VPHLGFTADEVGLSAIDISPEQLGTAFGDDHCSRLAPFSHEAELRVVCECDVVQGQITKLLYIFESPIDAMSHATLANLEYGDRTAWEQNGRLSLAGTSDTAIPFFLKQHNAVKELVFCLDNDPAGREAAADLVRKYAEKGYRARFELLTT